MQLEDGVFPWLLWILVSPPHSLLPSAKVELVELKEKNIFFINFNQGPSAGACTPVPVSRIGPPMGMGTGT